MSRTRFLDVQAGPAVVMRLLPQRPPFLMVDRIEGWAPGERPAVRAARYLTANEPVFGGHYPQLPLMPGALMAEGAAQTSSLVYTLREFRLAYEASGRTADDVLHDIAHLDRQLTLTPGADRQAAQALLQAGVSQGGQPVGVAGGIRIKFHRPVTPGCKLVYEVQLTRQLGDQAHFEVEATVDGQLVMSGSLAAAIVHGMSLP